MKIYLAGPMRGIKDFNFPAFNDWAGMLRMWGDEVFNPAEADELKHGKGFNRSETGSFEDIKGTGFNLGEALITDLCWIARHAEAIALMPGWEKSKGAKAELALAEALGLKVIKLGEQESVCAEADRLVSTDRQGDYGHPADDYSRTVAIFNAATGHSLTPEQGVVFMICVKLSREMHKPKRDNRTDGCGYFKCLDLIHERKNAANP